MNGLLLWLMDQYGITREQAETIAYYLKLANHPYSRIDYRVLVVGLELAVKIANERHHPTLMKLLRDIEAVARAINSNRAS